MRFYIKRFKVEMRGKIKKREAGNNSGFENLSFPPSFGKLVKFLKTAAIYT